MSWLRLATDALGTYRLTRLIVEDELTAPIREWIWKDHPPEETKVGYFVTCPYCASVWAGAAMSLLALIDHSPRHPMVSGTVAVLRNALALSGAVSLAHEVLNRTG